MHRQIENAKVLSRKALAEGIYDMWLSCGSAGEARPGQFAALYTPDGTKLLPRPISICETDPENGRLRFVYRVTGENTGTWQFSRLEEGDCIRMLAPLGNGFPLDKAKGKKVLLIGGGIGIPPLIELAKRLNSHLSIKPLIVAGYRNKDMFLSGELKAYGTLLTATEDGSCGEKGNVLDVIGKRKTDCDIIYACGPAPMLRAVKEYAGENDIPCFVSLEERMACGIGACLACTCKSVRRDEHTNVNNKRICKDGPVFLSTEVEI